MTQELTMVQSRCDEQTLFVKLTGDIHWHNSHRLRETLLPLIRSHRAVKVRVDMNDVSFMDSSGCAVFVEALRVVRQHGGDIRMERPTPPVLGLLEIVRLDSLFLATRN